jgi:hypothetical protein
MCGGGDLKKCGTAMYGRLTGGVKVGIRLVDQKNLPRHRKGVLVFVNQLEVYLVC